MGDALATASLEHSTRRLCLERSFAEFTGSGGRIVTVAMIPQDNGGHFLKVDSTGFVWGQGLSAEDIFMVGQIAQELALHEMGGTVV